MRNQLSVLTIAEVERLIRYRYDILNIQDIIQVNSSRTNGYQIVCSDNQYFLKEAQGKTSFTKVQNEYKINQFLEERDIPIAKFYNTVKGEVVWEYKDSVFHLEEYIDGKIYKMNATPRWLIEDSTVLLGRIHKELEAYPKLDDGVGRKFYSGWNTEGTVKLYKYLLDRLNCVKDEEFKSQIWEDLNFKLDLLNKVEKFKLDYDKLTISNSHGDYSIMQIFCGEGNINAIGDFTDACRLPICLEVIRSYTYADDKCKNGKEIDIENLKEYLRLYLKHNTLSEYDIKMMPYLYYYHLIRSRLGYKEYILSSQDDKKDILDLEFWRTNMCRWLDKNVDLLSYELATNL